MRRHYYDITYKPPFARRVFREYVNIFPGAIARQCSHIVCALDTRVVNVVLTVCFCHEIEL